jgi:hypothetical protein
MPTEISHLDKMLLRSYFFSTEYKRLDKFYVPQAFFERWIQQGLISPLFVDDTLYGLTDAGRDAIASLNMPSASDKPIARHLLRKAPTRLSFGSTCSRGSNNAAN